MPEDLRPAPRLPLDTANVTVIKEGDLNGTIVDEPGESVAQISLLETKSDTYYASAFNRQVYDRELTTIFATVPEAEAIARPVLAEFNKTFPKKIPPR